MDPNTPHADYIKGGIVAILVLVVGALVYKAIVPLAYFVAIVTFVIGWVTKGPSDTSPAKLAAQAAQAAQAAAPPLAAPVPVTIVPPSAPGGIGGAALLVLAVLALLGGAASSTACASSPQPQVDVTTYALEQEACIDHAATSAEATTCRNEVKRRYGRLDAGQAGAK